MEFEKSFFRILNRGVPGLSKVLGGLFINSDSNKSFSLIAKLSKSSLQKTKLLSASALS